MAAVSAGRAGARVALAEKNELPGRKYLYAAMGRGALTNRNLTLDSFHGRQARFVADALAAFPADDLRRWFADHGEPLEDWPHYGLVVPRGGPESALAALASALGDAAFLGDHRAVAVARNSDSFAVTFDGGRVITARRLVLAAGAPNLPQLGGETTGLALARSLGHELAPPRPMHMALTPADPWLTELAGLWMDVRLGLWRDGTELAAAQGSLLFTRGHLTGEAVFNLGQQQDNFAGATLQVDFFPELDSGDVAEWLHRTLGGRTQLPAQQALDDMLPPALARCLLARQRVKPGARSRQVELRQRQGLVEDMTALRLTLAGSLGLGAAEACGGGVKLSAVNPRTMESRLVPGLYIAGQMLDLCADWGGALQHASLATGLLAGRHAGGV